MKGTGAYETEDRKKHMRDAWSAAAEAAKQMERVSEYYHRIGKHSEARRASRVAEHAREFCRLLLGCGPRKD